MRETRQSGSEGGVRLIPHPYPYPETCPSRLLKNQPGEGTGPTKSEIFQEFL
jgi:hypothetical protein